MAYFTTEGVSNGGTEAINGVIEKTRRLAHGFRNFDNYRIRILLAADDTLVDEPGELDLTVGITLGQVLGEALLLPLSEVLDPGQQGAADPESGSSL